ncbi:cobalt ECF transporter T component CbiQ [Conexibacter woesei]|uniref:Cobalt ABC transporter, inner membrane subunit CbiQ n=1 Tax=Conexibacter woesei (strain DSM 14684 / CCUG 47730 / CIP 108061 / JCM 11494 / NBRC 100937 / ID131577) TaxID=469383 RepID=D3F6R1_CONWI|nr:cobalt ECF transporter T component CbiQ [Conexibacter woesei]ADB52709.1 cobalt ABC transporter, inner membrane subunit CbiQ [Conexibacter woesei DSM 14684]
MSGAHSLTLTGVAGDPGSAIHRLDPRAKLLAMLAITLAAVSTPLRAWPVFVACAAVLAATAIVARVGAGTVWRRARIVLPPVLLIAVLIPFMRPGGTTWSLGPLTVSEAGLAVFAALAAKAAIGTVGAVLLGATTSYPDVLRGLAGLRVPPLLTLVAGFMYRYLHVIAEELRRTRAALASRAFHPRRATDVAPLGRASAALFLRTHARGERVYLAMVARGYAGAMPELEPLRLARRDVAAVGGVLALLVAVRVAAEVAGAR